jgi:hypothetical protein
MAEFETRVKEETAAKEQNALEGMTKQHRERRALMLQHSPASWLHKRGGAMKTWKKRYCAIENGVLYYYVSAADREGGKPALGALVLHGSTVRRPSDLSGKGKYKNTCFRIDLDPHAQASNVKSVKGSIKGGSSTEGGFSDEEDESAAEAKGRTDKPKWILAAESERMMYPPHPHLNPPPPPQPHLQPEPEPASPLQPSPTPTLTRTLTLTRTRYPRTRTRTLHPRLLAGGSGWRTCGGGRARA